MIWLIKCLSGIIKDKKTSMSLLKSKF